MTNSVFRTAAPAEPVETAEPDKYVPEAKADGESPSPSPQAKKTHNLFATYQSATGHPFTAKHYQVEAVWSESGKLKDEVSTIEKYIRDKVETGELDNKTETAKKYIKHLEKEASIGELESADKKLTKLSAYIAFKRYIEA